MKGWMYMLRCAHMELYIGSTDNLEERLAAHHNGIGANFTFKHLPVRLVYSEEFPTVEEAFKREQQIKKWSRAKKEALIAGDIETLRMLSKNHSEHNKKGFKKIDWYDSSEDQSNNF